MPKAEAQYLDIADFAAIAEAILGIPAEVLTTSPRVVQLADSVLVQLTTGTLADDLFAQWLRDHTDAVW